MNARTRRFTSRVETLPRIASALAAVHARQKQEMKVIFARLINIAVPSLFQVLYRIKSILKFWIPKNVSNVMTCLTGNHGFSIDRCINWRIDYAATTQRKTLRGTCVKLYVKSTEQENKRVTKEMCFKLHHCPHGDYHMHLNGNQMTRTVAARKFKIGITYTASQCRLC